MERASSAVGTNDGCEEATEIRLIHRSEWPVAGTMCSCRVANLSEPVSLAPQRPLTYPERKINIFFSIPWKSCLRFIEYATNGTDQGFFVCSSHEQTMGIILGSATSF